MVIIFGLGSRTFPRHVPQLITPYLGDVLWAFCVYLIIGCLFPRLSTLKVFLFTILFAYSIEATQLYRAPWIDAIRADKLVTLVLGHGFMWTDIFSYTFGSVLGVIFDRVYVKVTSKESP